MALKDKIAVGMSLPHRSPDPIDMTAVVRVAQRAEALGFSDLWVTENTLDHVYCFDPGAILSYAAAITGRIRLGVAVSVLPVHNPSHIAHQMATLDYVSRGRAILGLGLGREHHFAEFQVPMDVLVEGVVTDLSQLRGATTTAAIAANEQIPESRLTWNPTTGGRRGTLVPITVSTTYEPKPGSLYIEGFVPFVRIRGHGVFIEKTIGTRSDGDGWEQVVLEVPGRGEYTLESWVEPCAGACGADTRDPATDQCSTTITVSEGEHLGVDLVIRNFHPCHLSVEGQ